MVTRRVINREARLRPCNRTNNLIGYVIATVANHHGIEIHALACLPNHYHLAGFDPRGNASEFRRDCHAIIAKLIKRTFDEEDEVLWAPNQQGEVEAVEADDSIRQIVYTMANPVKHGMVKRRRDYPGLLRRWPAGPLKFDRPKNFFRDLAPGLKTATGRPAIHWGKTAILRMSRPRGFEHLTDHQLDRMIEKRIEEAEEEARAKHRRARSRYIGKAGIQQMDRRHRSRAKPRSPGETIPRIKCADPVLRRERLQERRAWLRAYRDALERYRIDPAVVFPFGTNKMRRVYGVNVAPPPV